MNSIINIKNCGLNSFVENFVKKHIEELEIVNEPKMLVSQLCKWREECKPQPNPKLAR
jgi:hypothetical protein